MISIEEILKEVRRIELVTKLKVNSSFTGFYHSAFRGSGMQFSDTRTYVPGDDVRHIAWTLTARSPTVQVKRFEEDRELHVLLCIDASRSRQFGGKSFSVAKRLVQVAATLGFTAMKNQDLVGAWIFTTQIEKKIPFQKGQSHFLRIIRDLIAFEPEMHQTNLTPLFEECLKLKRRTIVFMISDFIAPLPSPSLVKAVAKKHDMIALHVFDPYESFLPSSGLIRVMDPETGRVQTLDGGTFLSINSLKKKVDSHHAHLKSTLIQSGLSYCPLSHPKEDTVDLIRFFLNRSEGVRIR